MIIRHRSIEERLATAHDNEKVYIPNDDIRRQMGKLGCTLGSLIGPSGVGKSHLIPFALARGGEDFSEAGDISSRPKRPTDPDNFRGHQPAAELLDRIEAGDVVQYVIHRSGTIYATDANSYTTQFVLLPTLTEALPQLQNSGCFEMIVPTGIVTDGKTWEKERMDERIDEARLQESLTCVGWLRKHLPSIPIIENVTGEEEKTAQTIVDILRDGSHPRQLGNTDRIERLLNEMAAVAARRLRRTSRHRNGPA